MRERERERERERKVLTVERQIKYQVSFLVELPDLSLGWNREMC